jgi:hypothetical protein
VWRLPARSPGGAALSPPLAQRPHPARPQVTVGVGDTPATVASPETLTRPGAAPPVRCRGTVTRRLTAWAQPVNAGYGMYGGRTRALDMRLPYGTEHMKGT